ncbi:MAG: RNA polymerase sigma factor [Calditrichia bacterium]
MKLFKTKYKKLTDEEIMGLVQQRDDAAFEELYNRYNHRILHYFYRLLGGDEAKAQDFLQDTFLKIIEKPHLFRNGMKFSTWIFTISHNLCKNEYRRLQVRIKAHQVLEHNYAFPTYIATETEAHIDNHAFSLELFKEINKLEPSHRDTFLLRFQENFSIREIGEIMECAEGTVKSRLFYTINKLATKLKEFDPKNNGV